VARRARTVVTVVPLVALTAAELTAAEAAFLPYQRFLAQPVEVRWG
jgi:hypothetical protein